MNQIAGTYHIRGREGLKRYPYFRSQYSCTLMLLVNIAQVEWVNVKCEEKLVGIALCWINQRNLTHHEILMVNQYKKEVCPESYIMHKSMCFLVEWTAILKLKTKEKYCILSCKDMFEMAFNYLTRIIKLSPIISQEKHIHMYVFEKLLNQYRRIKVDNSTSGYEIHWRSRSITDTLPRGTVFKCTSGVYLPAHKVCDGHTNCGDSSDEHFCSCKPLSKRTATDKHLCIRQIFVKLAILIRKSQTKQNKPFQTGKITYRRKAFVNHVVHYKQHSCHRTYWDSCSSIFAAMQEKLGESNTANSHLGEIACKTGKQLFFVFSDLCIYRLNEQNIPCPCLDGTHLENCKEFQCNMMFKCWNYYCIPWQYVCDNKWDCPRGIEESYCTWHNCTNKYKCNSVETMCIHVGHVCNGIEDCPQGEDEMFCEMKYLGCPKECSCLFVAVLCVNTEIFMSEQLKGFSFAVLQNCKVERYSLLYLKTAFHYTLVNSNMTISCDLFEIETLQDLNIHKNSFLTVEKDCFGNCLNLIFAKLMKNEIQVLASHAFADLVSLQFLNLSNNLLTSLASDSFHNLPRLKTLSLLQNSLVALKVNPFQSITSGNLETEDHYMCCLVPSVLCNTNKPWYISCSDLLPRKAVKVTFMVVSLVLIVSNCLSIVLSLAARSDKNMSNVIATIFININELFCGTYLCVIWGVDTASQGSFVLFEQRWKSSIWCHTASFFFLLFNTAEPPLLLFLSLARLMIVMHPIDTKFKKTSFVFTWLSVVGMSMVVLSVLTSVAFYFSVTTMSTSLCSLFVDTSSTCIFCTTVTVVVASVQVIISVGISGVYCLMLKELKRSKENLHSLTSSVNSNTSVSFQVIIISMSNFFCWIPTNAVHLVSLFLSRYPFEMVIWTAVAVAPINSVVNPAVFTATNIRTLCRQRKNTGKPM